MKQNHFSKMDFIADEIEYLDKHSDDSGEESSPEVKAALKKCVDTVRQLDPLVRERFRDEPEPLAEWLSIMNEFADVLAEDEAERREAEAEAAKEAEGFKLAAEIRAVMKRINADIDRLTAHDGPNLETETVLEQTFAALHDLDVQMRLRCRDFPEQLERWKGMMKEWEEAEALFERGREREAAEPAN